MYAGAIRSAVHTAFRRGLAIAAVHAAIQPDKDCLREGRKTRPVTLEGWGLVASCNPGGSGSSRLYQGWRHYFDGRHIIILPDNDRAGHKHAARLRRRY